jgi:hypothetical protein
MAELKEAGVKVDLRKGSMAYSPSAIKGEPGTFILDPSSSIGALRHEMRHFRDDQAAGYPGLGAYLRDENLYWRMEFDAYMEEIRFARKQGDFDIGRRIVQNMEERRAEILGEQTRRKK